MNDPLTELQNGSSESASSGLEHTTGLTWRQLELWRGDRCLQRNLNGHIAAGHALTLRGPNGCGKTTLIRTLCGLSEPETGEVLWNGAPVRSQRSVFYAALAFAGHRAGLKDDLTARENLRFAARLQGGEAEPEGLLEALQLSICANLPVSNLSAGQRRRVTLARVLASGQPFWVLDEPFTNLDRSGRAWLAERFNSHLRSGGMLLLAAHQDSGIDPQLETILDLQEAPA